MRKSRKMIAILATLAMLATLLVPMATPAAAAGEYSAVRVPTSLNDDAVSALATVQMEFPAGSLAALDQVVISLPADFQFVDDGSGDGDGTNEKDEIQAAARFTAGGPNIFAVPLTFGGDVNALCAGADGIAGTADDAAPALTVAVLNENEISLEIPAGTKIDPGEKSFISFALGAIYVPSGEGKDIDLTFEPAPGSGFPAGSVMVGRTTGGVVTIAVTNKDTSNNLFEVTLRIKESTTGSLEDETESLEFSLPDGYEWITAGFATRHIYGDNICGVLTTADFTGWDSDELKFSPRAGFAESTTNPSCFDLTLRFQVTDESEVETGDIEVTVSGESSVATSSLIVGEYGEYSITASVDSVETVFAGKRAQEISDIVIKEGIAGSLIKDRTVLLTLPPTARWERQVAGTAAPANSDTDQGIRLDGVSYTGTDDRTAKYVVTGGPSTSAAELTLENLEIAVQPNIEGDIELVISGTSGVTGSVIIAKAVKSVTMKAENKKDIVIGKGSQPAGDIIIEELEAGAISEDKSLLVDLPEGISFTKTPKVEVIEGDIDINEAGIIRQNSAELTKDNQLVIPIENDSKVASKIKISGIMLSVDRTVPEGNVTAAVTGAAVNETGGSGKVWQDSRAAASCVVAEVITSASGEQKAKVVFTINNAAYTVNGVEQTLDVAPYIKDGRTFIPVRYAAQACGVTPENILFSEGKVTLIKGDKVVQLTIGSNAMVINGISITMDTNAEIKDGRTMLPFRWVAQALGAKVSWDEATQTVTMEL